MKSFLVLVGSATIALAAVLYGSSAIAQEMKAPPLPIHTIEGVGGGAITPMAYLVNPAPECKVFGKPSVSASYAGLQGKSLDSFAVTQNLWGRIEFGFAANRFGLGNLPGAIQTASTIDIERSDLWLYHFNLRGLVVKERQNDIAWMPAITIGAHFKTNEGIRDINNKLGGALNTVGYARENGTDVTLTATKTFITPKLGMPVIVTLGVRGSQASDIGLLGFGNDYHATFEGSVAVVPHERWILCYEYRQKKNPYTLGLPTLIGNEDDWHAFDAAYIMDKHATLCVGYGIFGTLANTEVNSAWFAQLKYEF